jgi:hypothetical protein
MANMQTTQQTAQHVNDAVNKADTIAQAMAALSSGAKILSSEIVHALVQCSTESCSSVREQTMVYAFAQHHFRLNKLSELSNKHASQLGELQRQLADLRTYLGVPTPEALSAAVGAGESKPLPAAPVTPVKHIAVSERDRILEQAKERAKEAQAAAQEQKGKE